MVKQDTQQPEGESNGLEKDDRNGEMHEESQKTASGKSERRVPGAASRKARQWISRSMSRATSMTFLSRTGSTIWNQSKKMRLATKQVFGNMKIPEKHKKHITFYRVHFLSFVIVDLIGTFVLWASPGGPDGSVGFVDALFTSTSAVCVTGLSVVSPRMFSTFDFVVILTLMVLGSHVFTSLVPVFVRRFYFTRYLHKAANAHSEPEGDDEPNASSDDNITMQNSSSESSIADFPPGTPSVGNPLVRTFSQTELVSPRIRLPAWDFEAYMPSLVSPSPAAAPGGGANVLPFFSRQQGGEAANAHTWAGDTAKEEGERFKLALELMKVQQMSRKRIVRAGSIAVSDPDMEDATSEVESLIEPGERRFIEMQALKELSWIVPAYLFSIIAFATAMLFTLIQVSPNTRNTLSQNGVNNFFMAAFNSVAGFTNAGFSLLEDNMVQFNQYAAYLLVVALLILLGNTMYAPCLRGVILLLHRFSKGDKKLTYRYLLDHPRKCYTHLFPPRQTVWLILTVVGFISFELFFFVVLDWTSPALTGLSAFYKIVDGAFQSVSTRVAGFNVIAIALLSSSMLVLYCGLMYVAIYPVYLSRQNTRQQREVYDREDIGIFYEDLREGVLDDSVLNQSKRLIGQDSLLIFLSIFFVCIIEAGPMQSDPNFSIFAIIFEVISAYGNNGLSLGYTCVPASENEACISPPYSFSGAWKVLSKLILVALMLLGRHRGLPDNIDAAITIPKEKQFRRFGRQAMDPSVLGDDSQHRRRASLQLRPEGEIQVMSGSTEAH